MRFHVETKELQAGILTVVKSLASRPSLPILEGIYIAAANNELLLRCSDLTLQIDCTIAADVQEEGATVLPGRLFSEMVRKMSSDFTDVELNGKVLQIKAGRSKMNLQCTDPTEFPDMNNKREAIEIPIAQNTLKEMIRQTVFATAQDDSKPILMGALCEVKGNDFNMVALDGFRLALRHTPLLQSYMPMEAVVPSKSLIEISRTLLDVDEVVVLSYSKTHLSVDLGAVKVISRLLDGDFIRYQAILPKEHNTRVRVNRLELLDSVERAILLAREGNNNLVRFTIEEGKMELFANSALGKMEEEIEIGLNGAPIQIAFNARYFSDALKALDDEEIYMDMQNNVSPCVVKPLHGERFYYLILPVRIFS